MLRLGDYVLISFCRLELKLYTYVGYYLLITPYLINTKLFGFPLFNLVVFSNFLRAFYELCE